VFCDLVGSTALGERLDSESLREVMDRYFNEMRNVLERHGGIVEKYIGDAIMAIFGLPRAHEDDALRAVRAVAEMGPALDALNTELERDWSLSLANRTGVNTGVVVVGDLSSGQRLATGDAVNVAARLEQAAFTDSVLIGDPTYRLVKDAVMVEAVEPLALKGKPDPLPAFRLVEVTPKGRGISRRLDAPLVGRSEELSALLEAFESVVQEGSCRLVTVLGEAGVGKSRLLAELPQRLQGRAQVLTGRCLSYGEGITFWPVTEIVRQAAGIRDEDSAGQARHKIEALVEGVEYGIADRIASVVGLASASFPLEESFWAARRLLEQIARRRPLVVIFEDIHWAESTFLVWIEYVLDLAQGPILMVCAARPELPEERSSWSGPSAKAALLDLHPLTGSESDVLIDSLLGASGASQEIKDRIAGAAQGNPLFVEQIISMWIDEGALIRNDRSWQLRDGASVAIPPTISALLAARLDQLGLEERAVIASASVVGHVFYQGAVEELCPATVKTKVSNSLSALEEKQFVRPDPSTFADEQAFAFRHVLIRDAVYEAILKRTRADLHERFASWLERVEGERITEYEEIIGYHLEKAHRLSRELGRAQEYELTLGQRAAERLASAGHRALSGGDISTATGLLQRAADLLSLDDRRLAQVLSDLGWALANSGQRDAAYETFSRAALAAEAAHDATQGLHVKLRLRRLQMTADPVRRPRRILQESKRAIEVLERGNDARGLAIAWALRGWVYWGRCQAALAEEAWIRAAGYARATGDQNEEMELLWLSTLSPTYGPMPVTQALERYEKLNRRWADWPSWQASYLDGSSLLEAMLGSFDVAREKIRKARALYQDLGLSVAAANTSQSAGQIEMIAGDFAAAERELRAGFDTLESMGEQAFLSTVAGHRAHAAYSLDRLEDAERYSHVSEEAAPSDDVFSQVLWRSARAKVFAQRNDTEGEELAKEAVSLSSRTDFLNMRADALVDLAEVLRLRRKPQAAVIALEKAARLYERKGNIVSAQKSRRLVEH
jgi:predicted ATPase/class 3 adenylate cyclase